MKLRTKLLLGATLVAGLSVSAFAACANDVDFGGTKKITGLADGTTTGEAVTHDQVLKVSSVVDIPELNTTRMQSWDAVTNVRVRKVGKLCTLNGLVKNVSDATITARTTFGTIPNGYIPLTRIYRINHQSGGLGFTIETSGAITIAGDNGGLEAGNGVYVSATYLCS